MSEKPFTPRPKQQEVLEYPGGKMGVSAVPGSGKTWTLSHLAADIIDRGALNDEQEVLVVTLVNSAVDHFYKQVGEFIKAAGLLPHMGYRVRTLHGLANDIVRERPDLVGLADNFQIVDEREASSIRNEVARIWLNNFPYNLDDFFDPEMEDNRLEWVRREHLPKLVESLALSFIRYAKDKQLDPERLRENLDRTAVPLPLAEMGWEIYRDYQRALAYRGGVDFDDLIRLALDVLQRDETLLERLRDRWPYILEDEAQDSSWLQEQILATLAGVRGNWVRVGDPNQAIYETFTTANPIYLRRFIEDPQVLSRELPESGRSTLSIIQLANHLIEWTMDEHPVSDVRDALGKPLIQPVGPEDQGANPSDEQTQVHLVALKFTPSEEILAVADSLERWLPDHPDDTVAVLVPRNLRAGDLVAELEQRKLPYHDGLLRSSRSTRLSAGTLGNLLRYLADPGSSSKMATVYKVWRRADRDDDQQKLLMERTSELLRKCRHVEDFVWPRPDQDWLAELGLAESSPETHEQLLEFRELLRRWQEAILLPVDQITLTLAQDLFSEPTELAIAHKLAVLLRQANNLHPEWRLPELTQELAVIARNERRFLGFSEDDRGFDPKKHRGQVVISTMHKAKGLEWDRVYLMSVNNYDFPSGSPGDYYIAEKWFIRDDLNLEAEALGQLDALLERDEYDWYQEGQASQKARLDYVRERLRLLYVSITRARKELVITWNTGRRGDMLAAMPFLELLSFWESKLQKAAD